MKYHDDIEISERDQDVKIASIIFFDFGALNIAAGFAVVGFSSLHLESLGFGWQSVVFGILFLILGLIAWKRSPIILGIAVILLIIDVISTLLLLSQIERAPFAFLVRISFLIPIIFMLRKILPARRRIKAYAADGPMLVSTGSSQYVGQSWSTSSADDLTGVSRGGKRRSKDLYALLSSMLLSVGAGIIFFLLFMNFIVPALIESSNPLINIFQDVIGIPLLLLAFPVGCVTGELVWALTAMRPFFSKKETSSYMRYGKQIPILSRVAQQVLDASYRNETSSSLLAGNQSRFSVNNINQGKSSRFLTPAKVVCSFLVVGLMMVGAIFAASSILQRKQVGSIVETPVPPNTIVVSTRGPGQYRTISEAIKNAPSGGNILVRPGLYQESLVIDRPVQITGDTTGEVKIESDNSTCLLIKTDKAVVRGLTLHSRTGFLRRLFSRRGSPAVVILRSKPTLEECDLSSDTAEGLVVDGSTAEPVIKKSRIHDSRLNGVLFTGGSKGTLEECEVFNNGWAGVRVEAGSDPVVKKCRLHHGQMSGVMIASGGVGTFEDCDIFANNYPGVVVREKGHPSLLRCNIFSNKQAGVFIHENSSGRLEDCDIYGNVYSGVHVTEGSHPIIKGCRIHNGKTAGLSFQNGGMGTVDECLIFANEAVGIFVTTGSAPVIIKSVIRANKYSAVEITEGGNPLLQHCRIYDGKMSGLNVYDGGRGVIEDCDIFGNVMVGVAIRQAGNPLIRTSKIHDGIRGGILILDSGLGHIEGCEIFGNSVGVEIQGNSNPTLLNCKINHNRFEGVAIHDTSGGTIEGCDLTGNAGGAWRVDSGSQVLRQENRE